MAKTINEVLAFGSKYLKKLSSNRTEAEVLLSYVLKKSKTDLYRNVFENIEPSLYIKYKELLKKRLSGEPLSYITGKREFFGIQLSVASGALIPRQETEILVEEGLKFLKNNTQAKKDVLEIGIGCGAISIALCLNCPDIKVDATDISEDAICIAKVNIEEYSLNDKISLYYGDLFSPIPTGKKYDLIISNPPYIPSERIKNLPKDVQAEPLVALNGGKEGLEIIDKILCSANEFLKKNGLILIEIDGGFQENKVKELFCLKGLRNIFIRKDLAGIPRVIGGYLL
ncbi:MAG TPA: peptide chain release factor N(5)-glutamine methyltransferase [Caldisericia bacterium]|nr:peptide chain release factor N(5)-glutamine methyltransferase [Caldisericia bacterium]